MGTCLCTHEGQRAFISQVQQHPYIRLEDVGRLMYDAQFAWSRDYWSSAYWSGACSGAIRCVTSIQRCEECRRRSPALR
jgi:hypothetical protein